jgi:hypothetical protein
MAFIVACIVRMYSLFKYRVIVQVLEPRKQWK